MIENKAMRVLFLSGGIDSLGNHEHRFLKALLEAGHETTLVSYHPEDISKDIRALAGVRIIQKKPRRLAKFQRYCYFTRLPHFKRVLEQVRPDIIHSGNVWSYSFLGALSGFRPLLVMPMGSDLLIHARQYAAVRLFSAFTIKRADYVIPDCEEVKKVLEEEYKFPMEKMFVFPCGVELDVFAPGGDRVETRRRLGWEDEKVLIMTRHFEPVYGIQHFVRSLPKIMAADPEVRALLVGNGSLRGQIEGLIEGYGIGDKVKLVGRIPRQEMVKYLNAADIYVSSSLSDGTSVSLLEAMACQLPVVVSDVSANREWVADGHNGFVVPRKAPEALADKILALASDSALRAQMGERNIGIVRQRADWRRNFVRLEQIYRQLVAANA